MKVERVRFADETKRAFDPLEVLLDAVVECDANTPDRCYVITGEVKIQIM